MIYEDIQTDPLTHEDVEGEGEGDDEDGEDKEGLDEGREDLLEHHHVEAVQVEPGQRKNNSRRLTRRCGDESNTRQQRCPIGASVQLVSVSYDIGSC